MDNKAVLRMDGLEIEVSAGIVWCGADQYAEDGGEAVCCDWELVPEGLQAAFLELRGKWSETMKAFMENNRDALCVLKRQLDEGYRVEREAWAEHKLSLVDARSHCDEPGDYI